MEAERIIQPSSLLGQDEFEMNMRLIGAPKLSDITEDMVDARAISHHEMPPAKSAYHSNCRWASGDRSSE